MGIQSVGWKKETFHGFGQKLNMNDELCWRKKAFACIPRIVFLGFLIRVVISFDLPSNVIVIFLLMMIVMRLSIDNHRLLPMGINELIMKLNIVRLYRSLWQIWVKSKWQKPRHVNSPIFYVMSLAIARGFWLSHGEKYCRIFPFPVFISSVNWWIVFAFGNDRTLRDFHLADRDWWTVKNFSMLQKNPSIVIFVTRPSVFVE